MTAKLRGDAGGAYERDYYFVRCTEERPNNTPYPTLSVSATLATLHVAGLQLDAALF